MALLHSLSLLQAFVGEVMGDYKTLICYLIFGPVSKVVKARKQVSLFYFDKKSIYFSSKLRSSCRDVV